MPELTIYSSGYARSFGRGGTACTYLSVSKENELDANGLSGDNKVAATYQASLDALKQQVKLLAGSFWFESGQNEGSTIITIIV